MALVGSGRLMCYHPLGTEILLSSFAALQFLKLWPPTVRNLMQLADVSNHQPTSFLPGTHVEDPIRGSVM
jgi:hypothetical protein